MSDLYKPARPHNSLMAPAMCFCAERCAQIVLDLRCPVTDNEGRQCGDYKRHRTKYHSLLVCTTFEIAAAILDAAATGPAKGHDHG